MNSPTELDGASGQSSGEKPFPPFDHETFDGVRNLQAWESGGPVVPPKSPGFVGEKVIDPHSIG